MTSIFAELNSFIRRRVTVKSGDNSDNTMNYYNIENNVRNGLLNFGQREYTNI